MWQILDGTRPAKSCGAYEFINVLIRVHTTIVTKLEEDGMQDIKAKFAQVGGPKYVFDHVRYHETGAQLARLYYNWFTRIDTPAWSPDFNKQVEHAHGTVKRAFKEHMRRHKVELDMPGYKKLLLELATRHITVDSVRRDVHTLPTMWQVIAAKKQDTVLGPNGKEYRGVDGDWTPSELR